MKKVVRAWPRRSGGKGSDRGGRRYDRALFVFQTGDADVDEKQGDVPDTDADGGGIYQGETRWLSAGVAGESNCGLQRALGDVPERAQDRSEDLIRDGCGGFSARTERKGI